jgi:hypothetical protein
MTRVAVGVSVASAAILTLVTAALYRTGPADAPATGVALIPFDALQAHTLELTLPDSQVVAARRIGASLDWWITIDPAGGAPRRAWPASEPTIRAALRVLDDLAIESESGAATLDTPAATVRIATDDDEFTARLGEGALAGRADVEITDESGAPRVVSVSSSLHDLLLRPGPAGWREPSGFPSLAGPGATDVSRIELRTADRALLFTRIEGRWFLFPNADQTTPALPADRDTIDRLLTTVAGARVTRFIDEPTDDTGLAEPTAVLTLESTQRLPSGERQVRARTLSIGLAANLGATAVYASLEDSLAQALAADALPIEPQVVAVEAGGLAGLSLAPESYLDPIALRAPVDDVGELIISDTEGNPTLHATRTLEGWRLGERDALTLPTPQELGAINTILSLLATTQAEPILEDDATFSPVATIEIRTIGGAPMGAYVFGLGPAADADTRPVITAQRVAYLYPPSSADQFLAWLGG